MPYKEPKIIMNDIKSLVIDKEGIKVVFQNEMAAIVDIREVKSIIKNK